MPKKFPITKFEWKMKSGLVLKFSDQSAVLLEQMPDFPFSEFAAYMEKNGWTVGSSMIQMFLLDRKIVKEKEPANA